jgi:MYXO-CTERM domain-containing protein
LLAAALELAGCLGQGPVAPRSALEPPPQLADAPDAGDVTIGARILLISGSGAEPAVTAMRAELDRIGTPYTAVATGSTPLTPDMLVDSAGDGAFNGLIQATCGPGATVDAATTAMLIDYASRFGVRSVCLHGVPDGAFGLGPGTSVDARATALTLTYTSDGAALFSSYSVTSPLVVSGVDAAVAPVADDAATTPLLVDASGNAAAVIHRPADGSEQLVLTFDQAPGALHTRQLLYGLLLWVSRGVFLGEKRAYLGAQVDDVFLGTVTRSGPIYRMSGADLGAAAAWQQQLQASATGLRLTFAFNGAEVTDADPLTQAAKAMGGNFDWVSHTFDHHRLDTADYTRMTWELTQNDAVMQANAFGPYDRASLVTPDISALTNTDVLRASADYGIQRIICDGSQSNCRPQIPNTGLPNQLVPALFMIPRIADDLYANVSTPAEWVDEFNALNAARLGRTLAIDEILDAESDVLLGYLLDGNIEPWMFHQANLRLYDGSHALLTDLLDRTIAKYAALRVLPVQSPTMEEAGQRMQDRLQRESANVTATIHAGQITVRATTAARVPITGAKGDGAESYGAFVITRVDVPAGGEVSVPIPHVGPTPGAVPGGVVVPDGGAPGAVATSQSGCGCRMGSGGTSAWSLTLALAAALALLARRPRGPRY